MAQGFTDSFDVRVKKEIAKIKAFPTTKEKASYIWEYYKVHILLTIFFGGCLISLIVQVARNNYNTALNITYVNCTTVDNYNETHVLETLATDWLGVDGKKDRVLIDTNYVINPEIISEETYASSMKLAAAITAKQIDTLICDELMLNTYYETGYYLDLTAVLSPELLERLGDNVVYRTTEDGMEHPYAIKISSYPIYEKLIFSIENPMIAVISNTQNTENVATYIDRITTYDGNDDLTVSKE